jgi:type VI secretion system protein ImpA
MGLIDIDALLQEVGPDAPCGPNLEYDPVFLELEQAVLGKPEVQYGSTITAAVPPEWKVVKRLAGGLLERSRDLRVVLPLLRANLALHGIAGLAESLALIDGLLAQRWDSVHPQLDPDDDLDPTLRVNSLAILTDAATVLKDLKESPLIMLPGLGPLSLRVLEVISGELPPGPGQEKLTLAAIGAALSDAGLEQVSATSAALAEACASVVNIEVVLLREVGSSQTLNLDVLMRGLKRGRDFFATHMAGRPDVIAAQEAAAAEAMVEATAAAAPVAGAVPAAGAAPAPAALSGEIIDRADVLRALDKLLKYYQQYEPSSPVPLFLVRAKRLVPKSFMEIMEELAPEGMTQLLVINGNKDQAPE